MPNLVVWNELLDAALTLGTAAQGEYGEIVTYLKELWARFAAPVTLDWAIDALELLVSHPCADTMARHSFFVALLDRVTTFLRHVEPEQWELLRLSAANLGETEPRRSIPAGRRSSRGGSDWRRARRPEYHVSCGIHAHRERGQAIQDRPGITGSGRAGEPLP